MPRPRPHTHPNLARLGGHHEGRQPVVVEHGLQVAVGEEAGALEQQQVVHLGDELGVVAGVVGDGHQRVQNRVAAGVLPPHVRLLVRILRQVVDDVGLVGAGGQRQGQLACGRGGCRGRPVRGPAGRGTHSRGRRTQCRRSASTLLAVVALFCGWRAGRGCGAAIWRL